MEECLLAVWPGPFGWLLFAEPLGAGEIQEIADEVARREQLSTGNSDRFPDRAMAARRLHLRHAEMRKGVSTGLWRGGALAGRARCLPPSPAGARGCSRPRPARPPYSRPPPPPA